MRETADRMVGSGRMVGLPGQVVYEVEPWPRMVLTTTRRPAG
jgi:hypothetical protein